MIKVLVTGREGQLARSLQERGSDLDWLTLQAAGRPLLDLECSASVGASIERAAPDVVINAAAYTAVDQAEDEPERAFAINAAGATAVAAAAHACGARMVQISTDYVFDGRCADPYPADAATNPLGVYGRSKLAGEEGVRAACPGAIILRTAWVYSPYGKNFVKTIVAASDTRDALEVVSDQHGNPTSALDLADGLLEMLYAWRQGADTGLGATYHLAGSGAASWYDLAVAVLEEKAEMGGRTVPVRPIRTADWPTRAARPRNSMLDTSAFTSDFGYRSPPWRASVAHTLRRIVKPA